MEETKNAQGTVYSFSLSEMLECWETAIDSWAKECGDDFEKDLDEEDGYEVPVSRKDWFKKRFGVEVSNAF